MKIKLYTENWFDAAHHLNDYSGNCKNLHGHTYQISVWVEGEKEHLDAAGILWDFGNVKKLIKEFDHNGDMTDKLGFNSTAENLAIYFYEKLKETDKRLNFRVRVYEQIKPKKSWVEVGDKLES